MQATLSGWYPIALSTAVTPGITRAVLLASREVMIWRGDDGASHVWEDRCPHRGMRLSFGFVRGNALNCLYHGWQYGAASSCLRIPAHPDLDVPKTIHAHAFVMEEAGGLIWTSLDAEPEAAPDIGLHATPLVSVAVDVPAERLARCIFDLSLLPFAPPLADEESDTEIDALLAGRLFAVSAGAETLLLGLHPVDDGKTMLHALIHAPDIADDELPALYRHYAAIVRNLRRSAESEAPAAPAKLLAEAR